MLAFEMHYGSRPAIEALEQGFRKWMSAIEIDADKYEVKILPSRGGLPLLGRLEVTYGGERLFEVNFYKRDQRTEDGKKSVYAIFSVKYLDEGKELFLPGDGLHLNIDDYLRVNYLDKQTNIAVALQDVLPIRNEDDVKKIMDVFGVNAEQIKMDTYRKRYVVDAEIPELQWKDDVAPSMFYKYVPLEVFHKMLLNGTFRMNSIISQSDTQETFYIGDLACGEYEDEYKRFRGVLAEEKTLISSFTTKYDDPQMWTDYGGNGSGVCLCFRLVDDKELRQVRYIDERESPLMKYKRLVDELKKDNIRVHFTAIDDIHRFVKSSKYLPEEEWRLVFEYDGEVDYDLYGQKRCVSYKDFSFDGRHIPEIGLYLDSILVGPNQPEGASNFPMLVSRSYHVFGNWININQSRVQLNG